MELLPSPSPFTVGEEEVSAPRRATTGPPYRIIVVKVKEALPGVVIASYKTTDESAVEIQMREWILR